MIARITSLGNFQLMNKDMTTIDTHEHLGSGMGQTQQFGVTKTSNGIIIIMYSAVIHYCLLGIMFVFKERSFNMKKIYHYIFYINFFYLTKQFSARHFNEQLLTFYVHILPFREEQNLARCEKT